MSVLFTRRGGPPPARDIASNLSVGESVYINVSGVSTEFIVIHQGNPNPYYYNAACDGTWVMMKGTTSEKLRNSTGFIDIGLASYGTPWHTYFNETFLSSLDTDLQEAIKTVKIPAGASYEDTGTFEDPDYRWTSAVKDEGFETKVFALSAREMGYTYTNYGYNNDIILGTLLEYFKTDALNKRIAYLNGSATMYQTRSPSCIINHSSNLTTAVNTTGAFVSADHSRYTYYGRPAFILPYNARFDTTTKEFLGLDNTGYGK